MGANHSKDKDEQCRCQAVSRGEPGEQDSGGVKFVEELDGHRDEEGTRHYELRESSKATDLRPLVRAQQ